MTTKIVFFCFPTIENQLTTKIGAILFHTQIYKINWQQQKLWLFCFKHKDRKSTNNNQNWGFFVHAQNQLTTTKIGTFLFHIQKIGQIIKLNNIKGINLSQQWLILELRWMERL
jgi:hypothetical protein